jgi:hypothetical protein
MLFLKREKGRGEDAACAGGGGRMAQAATPESRRSGRRSIDLS